MAVREAEPDGHGAGVLRRSENASGPPARGLLAPLLDLLPREHRALPRRTAQRPRWNLDDERCGRNLPQLDQMARLHAAVLHVPREPLPAGPRHSSLRAALAGGLLLRQPVNRGNPRHRGAGKLPMAVRAALAGQQGADGPVARQQGALRAAHAQRCRRGLLACCYRGVSRGN